MGLQDELFVEVECLIVELLPLWFGRPVGLVEGIGERRCHVFWRYVLLCVLCVLCVLLRML